jgi:hypothetical protein
LKFIGVSQWNWRARADSIALFSGVEHHEEGKGLDFCARTLWRTYASDLMLALRRAW